MLRAAVLTLLLANVGFWLYTQGHLSGLGLVPQAGREPERLGRQVAPEALRVRNAGHTASTPNASPGGASAEPDGSTEATSTEDPPSPTPDTPTAAAPTGSGPTACWQVNGLNSNQTLLLRAALDNLPPPAPRWSLNESVLPARWIVYLGKFPSADALQRRRAELREARVDHREVNTPSLQPGLALGTYSTEEAAQRSLAELTRRGVANARVVQERQETRQYTLVLPAIDDAQRRRIANLGLLGDRPLQRCP